MSRGQPYRVEVISTAYVNADGSVTTVPYRVLFVNILNTGVWVSVASEIIG